MSLPSGTPLGAYVILSALASGGMGEVYKARDSRLNRLVALKILPEALRSDPSALARFEREARVLAGLSHPGIVAIFDVGQADGVPFLVTELLEGQTLASHLERGAVPRDRALDWIRQIAQALAAAHAKGIVHRDLKPSNVMIGKDGRARLLDFGLAREIRMDPSDSTGTQHGTILGTVGYMAPEQVRGEPADARSDLFALGVILLELLTGTQAFRGDSAVDVLHAILREDPLEGCQLPLELRPILERMLAKDPELRFQTARDLEFVLQGLAWNASAPSPSSPSSPTRGKKALIAATLLLAITGGGWGLWRRSLPPPAPLAWTQITVRPTLVSVARFSPDGRALAFSMEGPDGRMAIFSLAEGEAFPRATGQSGKVVALDRGGELFFSAQGQIAINPGAGVTGNLFRWKGEGTSPRVWLENILEGDVAPDGQRVAVTRYLGDAPSTGDTYSTTLESPPGKVLFRSKSWMAWPRWSPDGKSIAFIQHRETDWVGQIVVVDLEGRERFRSRRLETVCSLAWTPDGREIAFTTDHGAHRPGVIAAMDFKGRTRELLSTGEELFLMDIDPRGRMLLSAFTETCHHMLEGKNEFAELDLPFRAEYASVLSPDGSKAAFTAIETDSSTWIYACDPKTRQFTRLTPGLCPLAFSPDNAWLLVEKSPARSGSGHQVSLVPLGPGSEVPLNVQDLKACWSGALPDPDHPLVMGAGRDGDAGWYLLDPKAPPKPVAHGLKLPISSSIVALNSGSLWAFDIKKGLMHGSLTGGPWKPVGGLLADRVPLAANPRTGEILVVRRSQFVDPFSQNQPYGPLVLEGLDPKTLRVRPDRTLKQPSSGTSVSFHSIVWGAALAGHTEFRGHLYVVEGLLDSRSR